MCVAVDSSGFEDEMFKNSPFAGITHIRGNGSVPSIGSAPSLEAALERVEQVEAALSPARAVAKAAAKREGKPVANLFGDSTFVLRSSAEKWTDTSRREGWIEGVNFVAKAFERAYNPPDPKDPLFHIVSRIQREGFTPLNVSATASDADQIRRRQVRVKATPEGILAAAARARGRFKRTA
jgi:hypothetical protein